MDKLIKEFKNFLNQENEKTTMNTDSFKQLNPSEDNKKQLNLSKKEFDFA